MGFWSEIKETVEEVVEGVEDWLTGEEARDLSSCSRTSLHVWIL